MLYYLIMKRRNGSYKKNGFVTFISVVLIVVLFPFVLIWLIRQAVIKARRKKENQDKVAVFNMSQIDLLSGEEFELLLKEIFEKLGFAVQLTKRSRDFGADLIVEKGKKRMLIQAKCYSKTVGVKAVQEIVGAKNHYGAQDVIVATNNHFSKEAQVLAFENDVELMDRDDIFELIKKFNLHISVEKKRYCATTPEAVQEIESRYKYWI